MRYIRFDVVLQQNSLSAVCAVIVAALVRIDQGNGEIEDFCGESITVESPEHKGLGIIAGFSNPCSAIRKDSAL
ncbi:MAG: hypothetical protein FVQ85_09425 [Planctomycetes bacterium]|nr:hypothetical protein [Planctomycetota bacterium]